jgi:hypothetical protein
LALFNMIDDQDRIGTLLHFQFQAQLFFDGVEQ